MHIDPRLSEIDDSLYRVAVRALIIKDDKILAVKEVDGGNWWAIPGGGVDYGESLETCVLREIKEELGVSAASVVSDFRIVYYSVGKVVNGIPRMNVFYRVSIPDTEIKTTPDIEQWGWFTQDEFLNLNLNPSYDKSELIKAAFNI